MSKRAEYDRHTAILVAIYGFGAPCALVFFLGAVWRLINKLPA